MVLVALGVPEHTQTQTSPSAEWLQSMRVPFHQEVLRLNVSMTNAHCVDIGTGTAHLVRVQLDEDVRHRLLHFTVMLHDTVDRILQAELIQLPCEV